MYYLNKFDFKTKENICIYYDTLINIQEEQKRYAYNYIIDRQGDNLSTNYKDFVYINGEKPIRGRRELTGPFYIKPSKYDINKITVKEYKKDYGYIYNSYIDINHIRLTISKANNKVMEKYWKEKFTNHDNYKQVVDKINNIFDEVQNDKMYENIFEGTKSDDVNNYTEISSSSPIDINYNNSTDY